MEETAYRGNQQSLQGLLDVQSQVRENLGIETKIDVRNMPILPSYVDLELYSKQANLLFYHRNNAKSNSSN
jgi:hypothetical protein